MIFDTHAHYDDEAFDADRDELLQQMQAAGIGRIVDAGSAFEGLPKVLAIAEKYDHVYAAVGVHPENIEGFGEEQFAQMRTFYSHPKVVAVGEIGLDYHWTRETKDAQIFWFERQLDLARELKLPAVIHSRDAAEDTLEICRRKDFGAIGGVMHCYSYSPELARQYLDMGVYLGIGGVVTFKNARKLKETVAQAPLSSLILETDCPYLAPEPYRGKRNCSLYLPNVVRAIAEIKGVTPEEVEEVTWQNACRMYGLEM